MLTLVFLFVPPLFARVRFLCCQTAEAQSALDLHERRRLTASRDHEANARAALQRECAQLSAALAQQHRDSAAQARVCVDHNSHP